MAGRSFFRRLLGSRSDAVGLEEDMTPPSPAGPIHTPYPNASDDDDPTAVAKSATLEDPPDGTSQPVISGERVVADTEPTAFDEADAVFGQRTDVPDAKDVAPTEPSPTVDADAGHGLHDSDLDTNEIVSTNNIVDGSDDGIAGQGLLSPNNIVDGSDDGIAGQGLLSPNNVVDGSDAQSEPLVDTGPDPRDSIMSPNNVVADPEPEPEPLTSGDGGDGVSGIVSPNNVVADPEPEPEPLIDAGPDPSDGIISPNNIVADPDDDLVLADSSGGSIRDQLAANTGFSSGAADLEFAHDLDDLDDLDVD